MSRLFDPHYMSDEEHGNDHLLHFNLSRIASIWWMLLIRISALLLACLVMLLAVRRFRQLPRGRQLWRLIKSEQAEEHIHGLCVGQDPADGCDLWRASRSTRLTSPADETVEPLNTRVMEQGPHYGLLRSPNSEVNTLKDLLLCVFCLLLLHESLMTCMILFLW